MIFSIEKECVLQVSYYIVCLIDSQVGEHLFCMLLSQRIREYHLGVFGFPILDPICAFYQSNIYYTFNS
jgi:hypothetical protein